MSALNQSEALLARRVAVDAYETGGVDGCAIAIAKDQRINDCANKIELRAEAAKWCRCWIARKIEKPSSLTDDSLDDLEDATETENEGDEPIG